MKTPCGWFSVIVDACELNENAKWLVLGDFRWLVLDDCELAEKMKSPNGWFSMIFGWPVLSVS